MSERCVTLPYPLFVAVPRATYRENEEEGDDEVREGYVLVGGGEFPSLVSSGTMKNSHLRL